MRILRAHLIVAITLLSFVFIVFSQTTMARAANSEAKRLLEEGLDYYRDHRYEDAERVLQKALSSRSGKRMDRLEKSLVLRFLAFSKIHQGESAQAVPLLNNALSIVSRNAGKRSGEYAEILMYKAEAEYRNGKGRNAARTAGESIKILERLGERYRKKLARAGTKQSRYKGKPWDNEDQRLDLSEFFTTCENIADGSSLGAADSRMRKFLKIGRDYKPPYDERDYYRTTYLVEAMENASDRRNRVIYIPDEEHKEDWCVIYPAGRVVDRAVAVPKKRSL